MNDPDNTNKLIFTEALMGSRFTRTTTAFSFVDTTAKPS